MMEDELSQEMENEQVMDIITGYFKDVTGSKQEAQKAVAGLAAVVQDPGVKLVHLGDTVFMTIIKGKGFVEFHPLYVNRDVESLTKDLNTYVNYLKNIGVQVMFTYGGKDFPYEDIIEESEFDFEEREVNDQTAYYLKV
jgi:hypothetical protein